MKIEIDWKAALITLLVVALIAISAYYYRDFRSELTIAQMASRMRLTQEILGQLQMPASVAQALRQAGWQVKEQRPKPKEAK